MNAIRIRRKIESETLHLPELREMVGKTVEITITEQVQTPKAEADWEALRAYLGPDFIDPAIYKQQRKFDRQHSQPPEL